MQYRQATACSARSAGRFHSWRSLSLALGLLGLGLSSCGVARPAIGPLPSVDQDPPPGPIDGLSGTPIALPTRPEFAEIAVLEERRADPEGRLIELLDTADGPVRARAAQALGRLPLEVEGDLITKTLLLAMDDEDPSVRRRVAFALGARGDSSAAAQLYKHLTDANPSVRALVVEAGARIGEQVLKQDLFRKLSDPDLGVRLKVIEGFALWDGQSRDANRVDRELMAALNPHARPSSRAEPAPEEVWKTLYALQRRRSETGRPAFLSHIDDPDTNARLFATRGLARISPEVDSTRALQRRAGDTDWRIACEALAGLQAHADPDSIPILERASESRSAHVRAAALQALGSYPERPDDVIRTLLSGTNDRSPSVRAAALVSMAKVADPRQTAEELERAIEGGADPVILAGAARAAGLLPEDVASPLLERLVADPRPFVATAAIEAYGKHPTLENLELLRGWVSGQPDNGLRLAAVLALREHSSEDDLEHLSQAIKSSAGDVAAEVAWNALLNAAEIGGEEAEALLRSALRYANAQVRKVARDSLTEMLPELPLPDIQPPTPNPRELPLPGSTYPEWTRNPLVEVDTTRGAMVFELYPTEAPIHVYSFLNLAEAGHYDGLSFHRVVADFVVQGGDYRGDGNGGLDWRGQSLRQEFGPRPYVRGSLGMPRNDDPDSGGSQIFVTHRPTPHLNGLYTLFGQLVRGFDVLDRIEVGDRILSVERVPEQETTRAFGSPGIGG